ncbi:hypothetical protein ACFCZ5_19745 [Streptomyces microflavus]|uniref:hypothetical protein n=1 Tax=Streptomyces microflavus TaxID=1919 RepID=UPI0035E3316B
MNTGRGVLALMGSGETSPTVVTLHRELVARLGGDADAVTLETPYGFQVNRDDISTRPREYFRRSVGLTTVVAPDARSDGPAGDAPGDGDADRVRDRVRRADWVFSTARRTRWTAGTPCVSARSCASGWAAGLV